MLDQLLKQLAKRKNPLDVDDEVLKEIEDFADGLLGEGMGAVKVSISNEPTSDPFNVVEKGVAEGCSHEDDNDEDKLKKALLKGMA